MKKVLPLFSARSCFHRKMSFLCTSPRLRRYNEANTLQHYRFNENVNTILPVVPLYGSWIRLLSENSPQQKTKDVNDVQEEYNPQSEIKRDAIENDNIGKARTFSKTLAMKGVSRNLRNPLKLSSKDNFLLLKNSLMELARSNDRNVEKLFFITEALNGMEFQQDVRALSDILYYFSILNVPHEAVLLKISRAITTSLDTIYKPWPMISSIMRSLATLKVRDEEILKAVVNWCIKRKDSVDLLTAVHVVQALAILNYLPTEGEEWIQELAKKDRMEFSTTGTYVNLAWSLMVLDRVDLNMLKTAIDLALSNMFFITKINTMHGLFLKLANLRAYANLHSTYNTSTSEIDSEVMNRFMNKAKSKRARDPIVKGLIDAVTQLMPPKTFGVFVTSTSWLLIDAVCCFNKEGSPVQYSEPDQNTVKVAIILLHFKDLCFPNKKEPTGLIMFHKRFLEAQGFKVLFVPYNLFMVNTSLASKSSYLQSELDKVVKGNQV